MIIIKNISRKLEIFLIIFSKSALINILLALSNMLGIFSIYNFYINGRYCLSVSLLFLIAISFIHHLLETNEVGHNLSGVRILIINNYGHLIRYIDILAACMFFLLVIYSYHINNILLLVKSQRSIVFYSIISSFLCDFIIRNNPILYFFLHGIWHLGVYYVIYQLSLIN